MLELVDADAWKRRLHLRPKSLSHPAFYGPNVRPVDFFHRLAPIAQEALDETPATFARRCRGPRKVGARVGDHRGARPADVTHVGALFHVPYAHLRRRTPRVSRRFVCRRSAAR